VCDSVYGLVNSFHADDHACTVAHRKIISLGYTLNEP
jgi:hypothetical protein